MDSDDWLELNACKKLYAISKKYDVDLLQYGIKVESISIKYCTPQIENTIKKIERWMNIFLKYQHSNGISSVIQAFSSFGIGGKFIKTTLLKKAFSFIEDIFIVNFEDQYLNLIVFYFAKSYYGISNSYYHYRIGIGICKRF